MAHTTVLLFRLIRAAGPDGSSSSLWHSRDHHPWRKPCIAAPVSQSALGVQLHLHPPPRDAQEARQRHEANRRAWNEGAAYYTAHFEERLALCF
jgi:hypothetical protein